MKILVTGGCGFIGSNLAIFLKKYNKKFKIFSLDNFSRSGSTLNVERLKKNGIKNYNINILNYKKIKNLPKFNLIIHCAAEPAIEVSQRNIDSVFKINLVGTLNILKKCSKDRSKMIFLSTMRVYSINKLIDTFKEKKLINENFSVESAKSIYGYSKFSSEMLIKEFAYSKNIKYIINRLAVTAGPWQFGKSEQGVVSLWVWNHFNKKNLTYNGWGGKGKQMRDIIHINDFCELILLQIKRINKINNITFNVGGGRKNRIDLKNLTKICNQLTKNKINIRPIKRTSNYDIPYYVTDHSKVSKYYNWKPKNNVYKIVEDVYQWMILEKQKLKNYFI